MEIRIGPVATGTVVALKDDFDAVVVAEVRAVIEREIAEHDGDLYIDLREVTSMDSAAIGLIAFAFKRLHAASRGLAMIGPSGQPKQLLRLLRIDSVIEIRPTLPGEGNAWSTFDASPEGRAA